jgi:hypothetical protein
MAGAFVVPQPLIVQPIHLHTLYRWLAHLEGKPKLLALPT